MGTFFPKHLHLGSSARHKFRYHQATNQQAIIEIQCIYRRYEIFWTSTTRYRGTAVPSYVLINLLLNLLLNLVLLDTTVIGYMYMHSPAAAELQPHGTTAQQCHAGEDAWAAAPHVHA
eukprot:SAG11_NODE_19426_length_466_cov_8.828338_1_plen_117_part_10